jgi:hypothetical protein
LSPTAFSPGSCRWEVGLAPSTDRVRVIFCMTAINVIRQASAVHILSDGVFCNPEGIICEIGPNVFAFPHLPAALAVRGPTLFMPFLVHRLGRECQSFDDLVARVVSVALEVHISIPMTLGFGDVKPDFDLVAIGWSSKKGKTESFIVTARQHTDRDELGNNTWRLIELPDVVIAPPVDMAQVRLLNWKVPESAEAFQPDTDGIRLLEAQRLSQFPMNSQNSNEGRGSLVGGFVQLTTVSANGVTSNVLRRWPDKVGQRIEPNRIF